MTPRAKAVGVYEAIVSLMTREYVRRGIGMPDGAYIGRIHHEAAEIAAIVEREAE